MEQHRDYEALMRHGGMNNGGHPQVHPLAPPMHPQHAPAPHGHEMRAIGETLAQMQQEMAQLRQHGPGVHRPHHGGGHHDEHLYEGRGHRPQRPNYDAHHHNGYSHPSTAREFPIGFMEKAVGPGQLAEMEVKPQVKFQGHRLAVDPRLARYFNIVDIKVGKDSQLAATGEMPASAFSALAVGTQMELDTPEPGIVITLIVRNDDAAAQDFKAVLYGSVIEKQS